MNQTVTQSALSAVWSLLKSTVQRPPVPTRKAVPDPLHWAHAVHAEYLRLLGPTTTMGLNEQQRRVDNLLAGRSALRNAMAVFSAIPGLGAVGGLLEDNPALIPVASAGGVFCLLIAGFAYAVHRSVSPLRQALAILKRSA